MNAKLALTAGASLLFGLGLGFLIFHGDPTALVAPATATCPPSTLPRPEPRREQPEFATAEPSPRAAPTAPAAAPPSDAPATATLAARIQDLEHQLAIERAIRKGSEGERIEPPPGMPARLRDEKLLLETFNAAIKAGGFPGQVSNIDCSEHPCIVYGTGFGDRGDLEKLQEKGLLGPYSKDSFSTYGYGSDDGTEQHRFFGVAVMPSGEKRDDEARRRLSFRVEQMHEASKPPVPPEK